MSVIDNLLTSFKRRTFKRSARTHLPAMSYIINSVNYDVSNVVGHFAVDTVVYLGDSSIKETVDVFSPETLTLENDPLDTYAWLVSYLQAYVRRGSTNLIVIDRLMDQENHSRFVNLCSAYSVKLLIRKPII